MNLNTEARHRPFLSDLSRINGLLEKEQYEEARDACVKLKARCEAAGIRSSQLFWALAVASDYFGDFEMAIHSIQEAVSLDPLNIAAWQSFGVIVRRMREALADTSRPADDPLTPKLYGLLAMADEATTVCHLAMARYLNHTGRCREAFRLADAVTVVSPSNAEAWSLLAVIARGLGDTELVRRAETEAALLSHGRQIPFTIPGRADA